MTAPKLTSIQNPTSLEDAVASISNLHSALTGAYYERETEVTLLTLALIAEEHVLLLGPPGTAKTELTRTFFDMLGTPKSDVFGYLMGKFTVPDEIVGPLDLPSMKAGVFKRNVAHMLPAAKMAYLDEIFKANSSILNSLLTITNEREFDNAGRMPVPLQMLVGMSNELPEDGPQGPLAPLYDRFLFRRWTKYIQNTDSFVDLIVGDSPSIPSTPMISEHEIDVLRVARKLVSKKGPTGIKGKNGMLLNLGQVIGFILKANLENDHGITISDRRWKSAMKAVQAHAVLNGRAVATVADLAPLAHCLWDDPEDAEIIQLEIGKLANPDESKARALHAAAVSAMGAIPENEDNNGRWSEIAIIARKKIAALIVEMKGLSQSAVVAELIAKTDGYDKALIEENIRRFTL